MFALVLLFGPAPAILTVAVSGLSVSLRQRHRRLYRGIFNVTEPAISICLSAGALYAVANVPHVESGRVLTSSLLLPAAAMSLTYFVLNTVMQATALALENGRSIVETMRPHAWHVGVNYYAAGSLAALGVRGGTLDVEVAALLAPLLFLSYRTYRLAASRVHDAERHLGELQRRYELTIETLAIAVDAKDRVTHGHIRRVQRNAMALAGAVGVTDPTTLKALEAAALLHDIGKLAVPDYILNKPGRLEGVEVQQMKEHAMTGARIVSTVHFPFPVVPIVQYHHEQWGGSGYPDGLSGETIPLGARILAVVDCFDALTSDRPYRRRLSDADAARILTEGRGTLYDPEIVDAFLRILPSLRREDGGVEAGGVFPLRPVAPAGELPSADDALTSEQQHRAGVMLHGRLAHWGDDAEACLFVRGTSSTALAASQWSPRLGPLVRGHRVATGEGLVGWVAAHRHSIANSPADMDLGDAARELGLEVCTAVPVFAGERLAGVLAVYLRAPHRFSPTDVCRVGVLAQELGRVLLPPECVDATL